MNLPIDDWFKLLALARKNPKAEAQHGTLPLLLGLTQAAKDYQVKARMNARNVPIVTTLIIPVVESILNEVLALAKGAPDLDQSDKKVIADTELLLS